jgi:hypothetical protein
VRSSRFEPFRDAGKVGGLDGPAAEIAPFLTPDNQELFYVTSDGGFRGTIRAARRDEPNNFGPSQAVDIGDSGTSEGEPYVVGDTLWFASDRSGERRLYTAKRILGATFGQVTLVPFTLPLPTPPLGAPVVNASQTVIYFTATDSFGMFRAERATTAEPFTKVTDLGLGPLVGPSWLSPDGCRLYLAKYDEAKSRFGIFYMRAP